MVGPAVRQPDPTLDAPRGFAASMRRVSVFSVTVVAVWVTAAVLLVRAITWAGWHDVTPAFFLILVGAVLFELRPLTVLQYPQPTTIHLGQSFAFAALYMWGPAPAIVVTAVSWGLGTVFRGKEAWKVAFNVAQFVVSMGAAGAVMMALGGAPMGSRAAADLERHRLGGRHLGGALRGQRHPGRAGCGPRGADVRPGLQRQRALVPGRRPAGRHARSSSWSCSPRPARSTRCSCCCRCCCSHAPTTCRARPTTRRCTTRSTGVANRRLFFARLAEAIQRRQSVAVLVLDMDGFKSVNDSYGHLAGDAVLRTTAERIASSVRGDDLVARYGGDEFAVLLTDRPDPDDAIEVAERIVRSVSRVVPVRAGGAADRCQRRAGDASPVPSRCRSTRRSTAPTRPCSWPRPTAAGSGSGRRDDGVDVRPRQETGS